MLLFSPYYTEEVAKDVQTLVDNDIDVVLICNRPKDSEIPEHFIHFINLATPRPIVYTEDYDKVVQPHTISFNYIYYEIYTQMIEMTQCHISIFIIKSTLTSPFQYVRVDFDVYRPLLQTI